MHVKLDKNGCALIQFMVVNRATWYDVHTTIIDTFLVFICVRFKILDYKGGRSRVYMIISFSHKILTEMEE